MKRAMLATATTLLATLMTVAAAGSGAVAAPAGRQAATAPSAAACVGTIQINRLTFSPPAVTPGQIGTATLVARNCTALSQSVSVTWSGRFIGATTGVPAGCPVIDPIAQQATFAPHGQFTSSRGYLVFASCTASALRLTVTISGTGGVLAQRSADLLIQQPAPSPSTATT